MVSWLIEFFYESLWISNQYYILQWLFESLYKGKFRVSYAFLRCVRRHNIRSNVIIAVVGGYGILFINHIALA